MRFLKVMSFLFLLCRLMSAQENYSVSVVKIYNDSTGYYLSTLQDFSTLSTFSYFPGDSIPPFYNSKVTGTLTIKFLSHTIGQDYKTATAIAENEAQKVGADFIIYVSGTVYKDTEEIRSVTFRMLRLIKW
jgi:hypothetical protein